MNVDNIYFMEIIVYNVMISVALLGRLPDVSDDGIIQWEVDETEDEVLASVITKSSTSIDVDELLNMKDSDLLPPGRYSHSKN